jgi:hypothetical protein
VVLTSYRGPGPFTKAVRTLVAGGSLGSSWPNATSVRTAKRTTGLGMQWVANFNHGVAP